MLSPLVVNIILWVPFITVFLVSALVFCISGYKKGLWHALISFGITIASAVISFFLSKFIAGMVAVGIVTIIEEALPAGDPMAGVVKILLPSLVQAVLAVAFFSVIFFVLTLIAKIVGNIVTKGKFLVEEKAYKWGGLGVRVVDAIIYTVLLLLPFYGTIGTYAPTMQIVLNLAGGEETAIISEYLGAISNHPMVGMSSNGVFGGVYGGLMDASGTTNPDGSVNVNVGEVIDVMDKTMVKFEALSSATTDEEFEKACLELVTHLKDNVIDADWSYDLMHETTVLLKDEIVNSMQDAPAEEIKTIETVVGMLDMTKEEFRENGEIILDFMEYALTNNLMDSLETGDKTALKNEEFYQETATFLNATEQMTDIKKYLISETVTGVFDGDKEVANKIMSSYDDSAVTTPEARQQEIEAWMNVTTAESQEELVEALRNMPTLDSEIIDEVLSDYGAN